MYLGFKNVLIIEPQTDVGRLVRDIVKEIGASDAVITDSTKAAWQYLQTAENLPDWIITYPDPDPKFNLFHLLRMLVLDPLFAKTRVSLLISQEEGNLLPLAFDMGLMTYHRKPFTRVSLKAEFENLIKALNSDPKMHFEVATEYLRTHLNEGEDFETRVKLEKALAARFSKNTQYFLSLAEAQILAGKNEDARKTLGAAKHLGAGLTLGVKQLSDLLEPHSGEETSVAESFGIKNSLIVESDKSAATQIITTLKTLGIDAITSVDDGQEALSWLEKNGEPSVIIMEWKLAKINGPALVQRIRQLKMIGLPIIVISSLLKDKDRSLLKEFGVAAVIPKPIIIEELVSELINVFQNERFSSSAAELERKIRQLLEVGKTKEAEDMYAEFKKMTGIPKGMVLLVEATLLYHNGKYPEAREVATEALKEKAEAVVILGLLSKIFLKLNDRESALKCLNRAQEFSSDNIERLVLMAETYADSGNADKAIAVIDDAKKVDATNDIVIQGEAEIAIATGDSDSAKDIIGKMDSASALIANMNNRAVLMVNNGEAEKAIELYNNALASIPAKMQAEKEAILYNASLAFARINRPIDARKHLVELTKIATNKATLEKANSLLKRVESAIESKQVIKLNTVAEKKPLEIPVLSLKPVALHLQPGELCLHGIYDAGDRYTEAVNKLLKAAPAFKYQKMQTIKRDKAS